MSMTDFLIYEVNLCVQDSIIEEFKPWLNIHIKEMLDEYFQLHATNMRQKAVEKFSNSFTASRRILYAIP